MNCTTAKTEIALAVGDDLDESTQQQLQAHLAECTACLAHWQQMQHSIGLLQDAAVVAPADESMWPNLSGRLPRRELAGAAQFNGWVPGVAVAAVCLAMISIANTLSTPSSEESFELLQTAPEQGRPVSDTLQEGLREPTPLDEPRVRVQPVNRPFAPMSGRPRFDDDVRRQPFAESWPFDWNSPLDEP